MENQSEPTTNKNRVTLWIVALVLLVVGGFAVSRQKTDDEPIKIGVIVALTGKAAYVGEDVKVAFDLAAEDVKKEGIPVELRYEDHAGDPKQAVSAAQKLIAEGVNGLIVSMSSPSAAVAPVAEANKLVMLTDSSADSPALLHRYVFKDYVSLRNDCRLLAGKAKGKGYKIGALLPNFESGQECESGIKQTGAAILVAFFPMESNDFRTQITKLKASGYNFLLLYGLKGSIVTILKQLQELRYTPKLGCVSLPVTCGTEDVLKEAKGVLEGSLGTQSEASVSPAGNLFEAFAERFKAVKGTRPSADYTIYAYDKVVVLARALHECKRDSECAREYLLNLRDYQGPAGALSFDENKISRRTSIILEIKNGQFVQYEDNP